MAKPAKKLFRASMRPGLFGPGVGPELPFTPGAIHDDKQAGRDAESAAAAAAARAQSLIMPTPDDDAIKAARRRRMMANTARSGRQSTMLSTTDTLG